MIRLRDAGNRANSIEMKIKNICDSEFKKNSKMGLEMSQKQFDKLANLIIDDVRFERVLRLITKQAQQNHTIGDSKKDPLPTYLVIRNYKRILGIDENDDDFSTEDKLVEYLNRRYGRGVGWSVGKYKNMDFYNVGWDIEGNDLVVDTIVWVKNR